MYGHHIENGYLIKTANMNIKKTSQFTTPCKDDLQN